MRAAGLRLTAGRGLAARQPAAAWAVRRGAVVAASASAASAAAPQPHELLAFVADNGGAVSGCAPANFSGRDGGTGWGLQATADAPAGAKLIDLPARLHLTWDGAAADPRLLALIARVPEELWGAKLALQLLQHRLRGGASAFAPYVSALPVGFPGLPIFFSRDAVDALTYPPVAEQVKKRGRWLAGFARDVLAPLRGTPDDPFGGAAIDVNALGALARSRVFLAACAVRRHRSLPSCHRLRRPPAARMSLNPFY